MFEMGNTKVIAVVYGPREVKHRSQQLHDRALVRLLLSFGKSGTLCAWSGSCWCGCEDLANHHFGTTVDSCLNTARTPWDRASGYSPQTICRTFVWTPIRYLWLLHFLRGLKCGAILIFPSGVVVGRASWVQVRCEYSMATFSTGERRKRKTDRYGSPLVSRSASLCI